jgi:hypothetical protein
MFVMRDKRMWEKKNMGIEKKKRKEKRETK